MNDRDRTNPWLQDYDNGAELFESLYRLIYQIDWRAINYFDND